MNRDQNQLRERLSQEIFKRRFAELETVRQTFVDFHVSGYHYYRRIIAPILRKALKRSLKKEYETIFDLYIQRLPPEHAEAAIEEGVEKARENQAVIHAIGWFKDHFTRYVERYRHQVLWKVKGRIDVEVDYPWFFNIFRYIRENDTSFIFDPYWGFREKKKRRKGKMPAATQLIVKTRMVESIDDMIRRLREFKGKYPGKEEKIKTLLRRKKRVNLEIERLKGGESW